MNPPAPSGSRVAWLDRPLPLAARVILILICAFIPTAYVVRQYEKQPDLTPILSFGEMFQARALPEIRDLKPAVEKGAGFDGQFYAQIALDPTLRRPDLPAALDNPSLRAQRIFLPALAHVLGLGRPRAVVFAYALLNLAFWYALLTILILRLPAAGFRSFLVLFAIMLSTATLISVASALTDLPAATLGFIGLLPGEIPAALAISLAILTKPTCGLFLLRYLAPFPRTAREGARKSALVLLALVLPLLWQIYLFHTLATRAVDASQFSVPFEGWWHRWLSSVRTLHDFPSPRASGLLLWAWNVFEVLALFSTTVQAAFLVSRPRWRQPLWIVGAAFVVLFFCLSDKNFAVQVGYTRSVLPMTIAFNVLLLELRSSPLFFLLFLAGNIGLLEGAGEMLLRTQS